MFYIYIIYSPSRERYYIGQTQDINERLSRHNAGREKHTKSGAPWKLIHSESFPSRGEAMIQETQIKSRGAKRYLLDIGFDLHLLI
jgi:putative endonuclease